MFAKLLEALGLCESGRKLEELSKLLGYGTNAGRLTTFPIEYKRFEIPKRRGGARTIDAPSKELKKIQRAIARKILNTYPLHPAAKGYRHGASVRDNALPHVGKEVVINVDLENFFGKTPSRKVERFFRRMGWSAKASKCLTRLCAHNGHLPQGAATSPALSNLLNYRMDCRLEKLTRKWAGDYTRYSDDLAFSFKSETKNLHPFRALVETIIGDEGYAVQRRKSGRVYRRHQRQLVTGLVVNDRVNIPRDRRRLARAIEHHLKNNRPATWTAQQLNGFKSYAAMISEK